MSIALRKFRTQPLKYVGRFCLYLILMAGAISFALPFIWMVRTSIMPPWQVYTVPPEWIPEYIEWKNWATPWQMFPSVQGIPAFGRFFINTAVLAVLSVTGTVLSTSIAAYAFARLRFRGRGALFLLLLSTMMLPFQVTLIPTYLLYSRFPVWKPWIDTLKPLVVPHFLSASAYNVFLLRQFMMTIPLEYDEAARIDGASLFGIYRRIIMPLSAPALGVIAIQHFTWAWGDFMGPLIYLKKYEHYTLSIGLRLFQSSLETATEALMAATIMSMIPTLILFFVAQRYFIQGIVITGVKG